MKTIYDKTISIIIPVFNTEKSLKKCLESVINQTYSQLEIILIDDGSTDDSFQICKKYAQKDNRIVVLHHDNHGVSYTRNRGLDTATGEYIMFVDADDYALPDMIEHYYQTAISSNADIIIGGIIFIKNGKEIIKLPPNDNYSTNTPIDYMVRGFRGIFGYVPNKMYLRSLITENNLRFPEDYSAQEDLLFALQAYDCCNKVVQMQYAGYKYIMPEKPKELSFDALIKNKILIGKTALKKHINIAPLKSEITNILYSALFNADSIKVINYYLNDNEISAWIGVKHAHGIEKKIIIKLAIIKRSTFILFYFCIRKKTAMLIRRCFSEKKTKDKRKD